MESVPEGKGSITQWPTWSEGRGGGLQPMFSGLGPSAGAWGHRLHNRSQLWETRLRLSNPFLVEVRLSRGTGRTCIPWGERAQERGLARKWKRTICLSIKTRLGEAGLSQRVWHFWFSFCQSSPQELFVTETSCLITWLMDGWKAVWLFHWHFHDSEIVFRVNQSKLIGSAAPLPLFYFYYQH